MTQHDGRKFSKAYNPDTNSGYRNREQRRHRDWEWIYTNREDLRVRPHSEAPRQSRAARKKSKPSRSKP